MKPLNKKATNIEELGKWLFINQYGKPLSKEKESQICETWGIDEKTFTRLFDNYRKCKESKPKTNAGKWRAKKVKDTESGITYESIAEASNNVNILPDTLRSRMNRGIDKRFIYV